MQITESLVKNLAELARIELSDAEVHSFADQLRPVLDFVGQIQQAELTDAPVDEEAPVPLRADEVHPFPNQAGIIQQAPDAQAGMWKVDSVQS